MHSMRLLTLSEVADLLRLSPHTVRSFVRKGKLKPIKICRRLLFSQESVENLFTQASQVDSEQARLSQ